MKDTVENILNNDGIIVLDTNVYLNIYDRSPEFSAFSISVLESIKDKIILPSTVKREFLKNYKACYNRQIKKVEKAWQKCEESIKNAEENEQKLYAMLTLFMTHCNIPTSAKAEILNLATGVKKYSGDVYEIVEQVEEAIQVDIAEKGGEMPETPTLDEILEEDYMDLG